MQRRSIDAAVHVQTPPIEALLPYLSDYWAAYVQEVFLGGATSGTGRPRTQAPMRDWGRFGGPDAHASVGAFRGVWDTLGT